MNKFTFGSRYGSSEPRSSLSKSICTFAVGGKNDALTTVLMEPFLFQRNESSAVRLVPGRLEMFLAESEMSVRSSLAGREFTWSSRCAAQFVKSTALTAPRHWFVLSSNIATAFVTERSSSKIPSPAVAFGTDGLESSTTLMAAFSSRLKNNFAPSARTESIVALRVCKSALKPATPNTGSSARLLLSPGEPNLKSRNANAVSFTDAVRLVPSSLNL